MALALIRIIALLFTWQAIAFEGTMHVEYIGNSYCLILYVDVSNWCCIVIVIVVYPYYTLGLAGLASDTENISSLVSKGITQAIFKHSTWTEMDPAFSLISSDHTFMYSLIVELGSVLLHICTSGYNETPEDLISAPSRMLVMVPLQVKFQSGISLNSLLSMLSDASPFGTF